MLTSLEQLAALPVHIEQVRIEALQETVCLRVFSGNAHDEYEAMLLEMRPIETPGSTEARYWVKNYQSRMVALALCDEAGIRLAQTPEQITQLGEYLGAEALQEIAGHVRRLNKLDQAASVVLEEAEKNSGGALSAGSGSA